MHETRLLSQNKVVQRGLELEITKKNVIGISMRFVSASAHPEYCGPLYNLLLSIEKAPTERAHVQYPIVLLGHVERSTEQRKTAFIKTTDTQTHRINVFRVMLGQIIELVAKNTTLSVYRAVTRLASRQMTVLHSRI